MAVFTSLLFTVLVFYSLSLQGNYWIFFVVYFLTAMTGIVLAYCVASLVQDLGAANAVLPTYVTTCMYFGGLLILFDEIPEYSAWFGYSTFLRYGFNALMLNQFSGQTNGELRLFAGKTVSVVFGFGMRVCYVGVGVLFDG